jgi:hypothetical protein
MLYKRFTCRTEYEADGNRALKMLLSIGVHIKKVWVTNDLPGGFHPMALTHVTFLAPENETVETLQVKIHGAYINNPEFGELHRVADTLQEGESPNEEWFISN